MSYRRFRSSSAFSEVQSIVLRVIKEHPKGLKQAQIASYLGIPRAKDNSWITYYVLKDMVERGLLIKNDHKTFLLA